MAAVNFPNRPWSELKQELQVAKGGDFSWRNGRMFLYYYYLDDDLMQVQQEAYCAFWNENNMAHKAFPSLKKLETELVATALKLVSAPPEATATFTSGGSESIFLALKTARDWARAEKGISTPNVVAPRTCHPTFDRACHYLGIEMRRVPTTRKDFRAEPKHLRERLDDASIALIASAPNYPFGVFDPIAEIAEIARQKNLWMHVDACVGGFLAPWVRELGYDIPPYDFAVPGVTSISADLHKYGMAPKGASLMFLRDAKLQKYQIFEFDNWERGTYASLTTQGSRPAGALAGAWAVMHYLGAPGYLRVAKIIMDTKEHMIRGVEAIPGLTVLKPNELCIFTYTSTDREIDMGLVADALTRRGWFVGRHAEPKAIHLALNPSHVKSADDYLRDLAASVAEVKGQKQVARALENSY